MHTAVFCGLTLSCNNEIVKIPGNPTKFNPINI